MCIKLNKFTIAICAIGLFILGCSKSPQDYYPIKVNTTMKYKWVFEIRKRANINSRSIDVNRVEGEYERVFLPMEKLNEKEVFPVRSVLNNAINYADIMYIVKEKDGYASYAEKYFNTKEPEIYNNPKYLIKYPIEIGSKWDRQEVMSNISERYPVKQVCNIDSITDSITVPFGTFDKCLKVKCEGQTEASFPLVGTIKFNRSDIMWFAPGVGLVKQEEVNSCSLDTIPTYTRYLELKSNK